MLVSSFLCSLVFWFIGLPFLNFTNPGFTLVCQFCRRCHTHARRTRRTKKKGLALQAIAALQTPHPANGAGSVAGCSVAGGGVGFRDDATVRTRRSSIVYGEAKDGDDDFGSVALEYDPDWGR